MTDEDPALPALATLIEQLLRRHRAWVREIPEAQEVEVRWSLCGRVIRYHLVLEDVVEPDLDLEITSEALVVRARPQHHHERLYLGVLPVPPRYDPFRPLIRFEAGYLEVTLVESEDRSAPA